MDKPREFAFGLWSAAPEDVAVAWGARAIIDTNYLWTRWLNAGPAEARRIEKQHGGPPPRYKLDLLADRQGMHGDEAAAKVFCAMLNSGPLSTARQEAERLLNAGEMRTDAPGLFTLFKDCTVTVKANTNGSCGYLYMIAYPTTE